MKKITQVRLILLCIVLMMAVAACGGDEETAPATEAPPTVAATEAPTTVPTATAVEAPTAESTTAAQAEASTAVVTDTTPIRVAFLQPTTNAIIPVTSTVIMTATGVTIAPAGEVIEGQVHLHILIDAPFIEAGQPIPKDETHLHFGDGATTAQLVLPVGSHTLRLQAADGAHVALAGDEYRDEIVVNVTDGAPEQAVRFAMPTDGATVPPTFDVAMAATGLMVEPAGPLHENAGHFHILIDTDFIEPGQAIPKDETHLHFGSGQLTTTLELAPGEHTLRLQMADGAHVALEGDQYRDEITVTVADDAPAAQVYFVMPTDGMTVTSPVDVKMAAVGLMVERAGAVVAEGAGHMHILVDSDFVAPGEAIPADETHIHFGGGQLTTTLELTPGEHVLRLQMANGAHLALEGDQYRDEITVTVE